MEYIRTRNLMYREYRDIMAIKLACEAFQFPHSFEVNRIDGMDSMMCKHNGKYDNIKG